MAENLKIQTYSCKMHDSHKREGKHSLEWNHFIYEWGIFVQGVIPHRINMLLGCFHEYTEEQGVENSNSTQGRKGIWTRKQYIDQKSSACKKKIKEGWNKSLQNHNLETKRIKQNVPRSKKKEVAFWMIDILSSELIVPGYCVQNSLHKLKKILDMFSDEKKMHKSLLGMKRHSPKIPKP